MARIPPHTLNYGHFGHAHYSLEDGSWRFDRRSDRGEPLHQLGSWKTPIPPVRTFDHAQTAKITPRVADFRQAGHSLARGNPDITPSLDYIPELAISSTAITTATDTYDSTAGDLLSFSYTTRSRKRVAAFATGEAGNILRVVALTKERQGWEQDKSIFLEGPSKDGESGYWVDKANPIRQVCYARTEDNSPFLAVRFPTTTELFRPLQHDRRKAPIRSRFYDLPPSKINPNHILSIPIGDTGGAPHADVAFNPEYQRQLGLVDQKGHWSIWDLEGGHHKDSKYKSSCTTVGQIGLEGLETREEEIQSREDGWAKILWVGDVRTISVCSRRSLEVYDLGGGQSTLLNSPEVISQRSADWILDIRPHSMNKHQFFVLTSSRLLLMTVTCQNDRLVDSGTSPGATVLISWTHFRGFEDVTLQLCVPYVHEDDSPVIVFSALNSLVTVFRFSDYGSEDPPASSSSDPVMLTLDSITEAGHAPLNVASLHFEQLQLREDEQQCLAPGPGSTYATNNIKFYRLSVILSDLSIRQSLLYLMQSEPDSAGQSQLSVEAPSWGTILHTRSDGFRSAALVEPEDDFLVPDGLTTDSALALNSLNHVLIRLPRQTSGSWERMTQWEDIWQADHSETYNAITQDSTKPRTINTGSSLKVEDDSAIFKRVKVHLQQDSSKEVPRGTILDLSELRTTVSDIEDVSLQLQKLLSVEENPPVVRLQRIASAEGLNLAEENVHQPDISSMYDVLLTNWIAPLLATISPRVRYVKERLARRVATEVALASFRIRSSPLSGSAATQNSLPVGASQDSAVALPFLPKGKDLPSSLPTPSQPESMGASSSQAWSSQPPSGSQPIAMPLNPVTRLSQHLQVTRPPPVMTTSVNQILSHWQTGTDPSTYDWDATTRAVAEELHTDDETGHGDRARLRRKAERLLKRQRRELDMERRRVESQPLFGRDVGGFRSSPPPMVGLGMSSQLGTQSQSQGQSQGVGPGPFVVQSQVEPGRHGGRPRLKKKKGKGRVSGF